VELLEAFIQTPGIVPKDGSFIVVGHSFGACLSWHLAHRKKCPQINRMVIISPVLAHLAYIWGDNPMIVVDHNTRPKWCPRWLDFRLQRLCARMFTQPELANIIFAAEWVDFHASGLNFDDTLQIIDIPVQLIWGTHDDITIPRTGDNLYRAFEYSCPNRLSQALWIEGGSHALVADSPRILGQLISNFSKPIPDGPELFKGVIPMKNAIRTSMIRPSDEDTERPRVLIKAKSAGTFFKLLENETAKLGKDVVMASNSFPCLMKHCQSEDDLLRLSSPLSPRIAYEDAFPQLFSKKEHPATTTAMKPQGRGSKEQTSLCTASNRAPYFGCPTDEIASRTESNETDAATTVSAGSHEGSPGPPSPGDHLHQPRMSRSQSDTYFYSVKIH